MLLTSIPVVATDLQQVIFSKISNLQQFMMPNRGATKEAGQPANDSQVSTAPALGLEDVVLQLTAITTSQQRLEAQLSNLV